MLRPGTYIQVNVLRTAGPNNEVIECSIVPEGQYLQTNASNLITIEPDGTEEVVEEVEELSTTKPTRKQKKATTEEVVEEVSEESVES